MATAQLSQLFLKPITNGKCFGSHRLIAIAAHPSKVCVTVIVVIERTKSLFK